MSISSLPVVDDMLPLPEPDGVSESTFAMLSAMACLQATAIFCDEEKESDILVGNEKLGLLLPFLISSK
ncbi:MAG TPA: hypothetical protein PLD88_08760 [Candidatus Berkiella sp.]|nr:hypothetical protein [Candidatus Berkiella sp.]